MPDIDSPNLRLLEEPQPEMPLTKWGKPDIPQFARDLVDQVNENWPDLGSPQFSVGSFLSRFKALRKLDRILFGSWATDIHNLEVARVKGEPKQSVGMARTFAEYALTATGVREKLSKPASVYPVTPFSFEKLELIDLIHGGIAFRQIDDKGKSSYQRGQEAANNGITINAQTTIQEIYKYEKAKSIQLTGVFTKLLATYSPATTLGEVITSLKKIKVVTPDPKNIPKGVGYDASMVLPDGRRLQGDDLENALGDLNLEGHANESYLGRALEVMNAVDENDGRIPLIHNNQPAWLVGTGLGGEIGVSVVEAAVQGLMNVYAPTTRSSGSWVSAALVYRRLSLRDGKTTAEVMPHPNHLTLVGNQVIVYAGQIYVGAADVNEPGNVAATIRDLVPVGAKAIFAGLMYSPKGGGSEMLGVVAEHGIAMKLAREGVISGSFRLQSPSHSGIEIKSDVAENAKPSGWNWVRRVLSLGLLGKPNVQEERLDGYSESRYFVNGTARFQGLSYGLAQLFKLWGGIAERAEGLKVTVPTAFMTRTKGLMIPIVKAAATQAEKYGVIMASPESTGSMGFVPLVYDQFLHPEMQQTNLQGAAMVAFDGGVQANAIGLNSLFTEALLRSFLPGQNSESEQQVLLEQKGAEGPVDKDVIVIPGPQVEIEEDRNSDDRDEAVHGVHQDVTYQAVDSRRHKGELVRTPSSDSGGGKSFYRSAPQTGINVPQSGDDDGTPKAFSSGDTQSGPQEIADALMKGEIQVFEDEGFALDLFAQATGRSPVLEAIQLADSSGFVEVSDHLNLASDEELESSITDQDTLYQNLIDADYSTIVDQLIKGNLDLTEAEILLLNTAIVTHNSTELVTIVEHLVPDVLTPTQQQGMPLMGPTGPQSVLKSPLLRVIK